MLPLSYIGTTGLVFLNWYEMAFTEWYHYAFLLAWLVLLAVLLKYYPRLDTVFYASDGKFNGANQGRTMLVASFSLGLMMVLVWTLKPSGLDESAEAGWRFARYGAYGLFILLLLVNAWISIRKYPASGGIKRLIVLTLLMLLYFYSGMLGGLMFLAAGMLVLVVFALFRLKKTMTIR